MNDPLSPSGAAAVGRRSGPGRAELDAPADHARRLGQRLEHQLVQVLGTPPGGRREAAVSFASELFGRSGPPVLTGWRALEPAEGADPDAPVRHVPDLDAARQRSFECAFARSFAAARTDPALLGALVATLENRSPIDLPEDADGAHRAMLSRVDAGLPLPDAAASDYRGACEGSDRPVVERISSYELPGPGGTVVPVVLVPGDPAPGSVEALALQTFVLSRVERAHCQHLTMNPAEAVIAESHWSGRRADAFSETAPDVIERLEAYDGAVAASRSAAERIVPVRPGGLLSPAREAAGDAVVGSFDVGVDVPDLVADASARSRLADGAALDDPARSRREVTDRREIGRAIAGSMTQRYGPFVDETLEPWEVKAEAERLSDEDSNRDVADAEYQPILVDAAKDSDPHAMTAPRGRIQEHRFAVRGKLPEGPDDAERRAAYLERRAGAVVAPFTAAARGSARSGVRSPALQLEAAVFELTGTSASRPTPWRRADEPEPVLEPARALEFEPAIRAAWAHAGGDPGLLAAALPSGLAWRADDTGVLDPFAEVPGDPPSEDYLVRVPTPSLDFGVKELAREAGSPPERSVEHTYVEHVLLPQVERDHQELCRSNPAAAAERERRWDRECGAFDPEVAERVADYGVGIREQREHIRLVARAAALLGVEPGRALSADQHERIDACGPSLAASLPMLAPDLPLPPSLRGHPARLECVLRDAADRLIASPDDPLLAATGDPVAAAVFDAASVSERRLAALSGSARRPEPPPRLPRAVAPAGPPIPPLGESALVRTSAELDASLSRAVGAGVERLQQYVGDFVDIARTDGVPVEIVDTPPAGPCQVSSAARLAELGAEGADPLALPDELVASIRTVAAGVVARSSRLGRGGEVSPEASASLATDLIVHAAVTHGCAREEPLSIHTNLDVRSSVSQFRGALDAVRGPAGAPAAEGESPAAAERRDRARATLEQCCEARRVTSPAALDWVLDETGRLGERLARVGGHVSLVRNPLGSPGRYPDGRRVPPAALDAGPPPTREPLVPDGIGSNTPVGPDGQVGVERPGPLVPAAPGRGRDRNRGR